MTQLVLATTSFGAMTVASAIDSGLLPHDGERVLVVADTTPIPEGRWPLHEQPALKPLMRRFDRIVSWNDTIAPLHPRHFSISSTEAPVFQTLLRNQWGLGSQPVELVLESLQVNPALALAGVFSQSPIWLYSDGLMTYSPTRQALPDPVLSAIQGLVHLDLVPGLEPLLLRETQVARHFVPWDSMAKVVAELASTETAMTPLEAVRTSGATAIVVGQYLSDLDILTPAEESDLVVDMLASLAEEGHERVLLAPHPSAPVHFVQSVMGFAANRGLDLQITVSPPGLPVETAAMTLDKPVVASCFSTAMFTTAALCGCPVMRLGTESLITRLKPLANSNRVPLVLSHLLVGETPGPVREVDESISLLVRAVGYIMQPKLAKDLREDAIAAARTPDGAAILGPSAIAKRDLLGSGAPKVTRTKWARLRPTSIRRALSVRARRLAKRWS